MRERSNRKVIETNKPVLRIEEEKDVRHIPQIIEMSLAYEQQQMNIIILKD